MTDSVFLISLGCAKNLVDSEHMLGMLKACGLDLAVDIEDATIVVINTCGFIESAVQEAVDTILEAADLKKQGRIKRLVVAGCLVQRYGYKLRRGIPEVDGWLGTGEIDQVTRAVLKSDSDDTSPFFIGRPTRFPDHTSSRIQTTPFYTAYLRIAEGCSHRCSYCIIPHLRGTFRSRSADSLVVEARQMAERGVKEINIIAQDTTFFGRDLLEDVSIEDLLERLVRIKGIQWIRLLYCHPDGITDRLLKLIAEEEVICPYLDIPYQHVNKNILKAMGRDISRETPEASIERIRRVVPHIILRSTLMVGFPGEREAEFEELCDFVKEVRFDHLGVFVFSKEKGTPAARLRATVSQKEAEKRLDTVMALQADISKRLNQRMVGRIVPVMIEGPSPETDLLLKGRTATMAPDVDTQVLINKGEGVIGEIMPVLITEAHAYDLIGEIKA
ncbi:MAG: 30S ribosomal protein S12 methylthiotransferase RimO [Thermodesulfobacteriota bacterium]|nr:30S ribosomal protein S12 methylthiotransferase RimO [Thermodesulfobacteriota bacterium]